MKIKAVHTGTKNTEHGPGTDGLLIDNKCLSFDRKLYFRLNWQNC